MLMQILSILHYALIIASALTIGKRSMTIHNHITFQNHYGTPEMRSIWSENNLVQKWLDTENAMVQSMAELDLIPKFVASEINKYSSVEHVTPEIIKQFLDQTSHIGVSLVKAFNSQCKISGEHYHLGLTTQDILLTGLTLQIKEAYDIIILQMLELEEILIKQANKYKYTLMMGRTHGQHAVPTTFGFTLASWAYEIHDHITRLQEVSERLFLAKYTATVGTRSTWVYLFGSEKTKDLVSNAANKIGLKTPPIDIQTRSDRLSEIGFILANITTTLSKIGLNIRYLNAEEIREVEEPWDYTNQYSSSTMPNKRNPETSEWLDGLAKIAQGNASALLNVTILGERDATRVGPEMKCVADNFLLTSSALKKSIFLLKDITVNNKTMKDNLLLTNGLAMAEVIMLKLWQKTGKKVTAHAILRDISIQSIQDNITFKEALLSNPQVMDFLTEGEIEEALKPDNYYGDSITQISDITQIIKTRRKNLNFETPEAIAV